MAKLFGLITLLIVGSGASFWGAYLSRMLSFDSTLPEKLDEFETQEVLEGCVSDLFPGLQSMKVLNNAEVTANEVSNDFLGKTEKDEIDGCLVVNWNKESFDDGKWKGNFRLLWSARHLDTKGFVVFAVAEPIKGKKFKWTGAAYTLEKTKDGWKASKKLEVDKNGKEVDFKDKFPVPKLTKKANWGFLKEESDLEKLCESENCKDDKKKKSEFFEGYWSWNGSERGKGNLGEWTDKLNDWWKEVFGDDKWKMEDVVKSVKGEWAEKVWSGVDKSG